MTPAVFLSLSLPWMAPCSEESLRKNNIERHGKKPGTSMEKDVGIALEWTEGGKTMGQWVNHQTIIAEKRWKSKIKKDECVELGKSSFFENGPVFLKRCISYSVFWSVKHYMLLAQGQAWRRCRFVCFFSSSELCVWMCGQFQSTWLEYVELFKVMSQLIEATGDSLTATEFTRFWLQAVGPYIVQTSLWQQFVQLSVLFRIRNT